MRWSKIPVENMHGTFFAIVKVSESGSRYDANGGSRDECCVPSIANSNRKNKTPPERVAMRRAQESRIWKQRDDEVVGSLLRMQFYASRLLKARFRLPQLWTSEALRSSNPCKASRSNVYTGRVRLLPNRCDASSAGASLSHWNPGRPAPHNPGNRQTKCRLGRAAKIFWESVVGFGAKST